MHFETPKNALGLYAESGTRRQTLGKVKVVLFLQNKICLIFSHFVMLMCLSDLNERVPTRTIEQWNIVGARINIMWEEQLVDPPNELQELEFVNILTSFSV